MNTIKLTIKKQTYITLKSLIKCFKMLKNIKIKKFSLSVCLAHPKMQSLIF